MEGYCIWFTENALNKLLDSGFQSKELREELKGETSITIAGTSVDVFWEVTQAPSADFGDIDQSKETMNEAGEPLAIESNMFVISATASLGVKDGNASELPLVLVANPFINPDRSVAFRMVGLQMHDSYTGSDKAIIRGVCPNLLAAINAALGFGEGKSPRVISLTFLTELGISLGPEYGIVRFPRQIGIWGSDGFKDMATAIPDGEDIGVVMTGGLCETVITNQFKKYVGWTYNINTSVDCGIVTEYATGNLIVQNISCNAVKGNEALIGISPTLSLAITNKSPFIPDFHFDIVFKPLPIQAVTRFAIGGSKISIAIEDIEHFEVELKGKDSGILGLYEELVKKISSYFSDYITNKIREECHFRADIMIPDTTISTGIASLNASLTDYQGTSSDNLQYIYAKLNVGLNE